MAAKYGAPLRAKHSRCAGRVRSLGTQPTAAVWRHQQEVAVDDRRSHLLRPCGRCAGSEARTARLAASWMYAGSPAESKADHGQETSRTISSISSSAGSQLRVYPEKLGYMIGAVLVAASTVAVVAVAAAVIVVALLAWYVLPRGGRRKRPPRT